MPTVFITNVSRDKDYIAAERFGSARPVTTGPYPVFKTSRLLEDIVTVLRGSEPDDYLLPSGSNFLVGLCMLVWLEMHKSINVLLFDAVAEDYEARTFTRQEIRHMIEQQRDAARLRGGHG